jgi:hypothetical protein
MNGEGVVVYKDWSTILLIPFVIIGLPIWAIKVMIEEGGELRGTWLLTVAGSFILSIILCFYHKYLRGGIIIDTNARIISFPKVDLFAFFRPYPRNDISFDEITGIQAVNEVKVKGTTSYPKFLRTYKFEINGTFGTKTVSFKGREKRDQFYSVIAAYGNFS